MSAPQNATSCRGERASITRSKAHDLLNRARAGLAQPSSAEITAALVVTGDVDEDDAYPKQVLRAAGTWERKAVLHMLRPAHPFDPSGFVS